MFFSIRRQGMFIFLSALIVAYFFAPAVSAQTAALPATAEAPEVKKPKRKLPTGLLQLQGFKDPVYVYVPEGLDMEKRYPLMIMIPSQTDSAEKQLEFILPVAKSFDCFVLAPHNNWPQDTPYEIDRWLIKIKNEITPRFPIDTSKIYAIGRNSGGHYASYLVTAYPNEFSGAALIGEAWEGLFSPLLDPRVSVSEQMPIVAAFAANQSEQQTQNEKWFLEYQKRGYPVAKMIAKEGQDLNSAEFVSEVIKALDEKGQAWKMIREESGKTFKQKLKRGIKEFFEV